MNIVFLSPHFPPNFYNFCVRLRQLGATVLGVADADFYALRPELRDSLTEYYRVNDMHNYDELVRALGYFTYRYGKLDRIDSLNEFWLETEANLRTDFNIPGVRKEHIARIRKKSEMKKVFLDAGLKPARGRVCRTKDELEAFIAEIGYPVVAKPDAGVGAARTYKINNESELDQFMREKPRDDYIVEEFIQAPIATYDGLTDASGNIVFSSSLRYSMGVMEAVNQNSDMYYYFERSIDPRLEEVGLKTVKAFDVRERFFHFEFFLNGGSVIPMEVNMRPPGGLTLDMFNFARDFDCYKTWAELLVYGHTEQVPDRRWTVIYVGRKDHIHYKLLHEQVLEQFSSMLVHHERIMDVFSAALGNHGYILRHERLEPLVEAAAAIEERVE